MTGHCVNYEEVSCKITSRCIGTRVCAHAVKRQFFLHVRDQEGWNVKSHRQKILRDFSLPWRKSWFVLGREKGRWPFLVGVKGNSRQLLKCLQMFFPLRIHTNAYTTSCKLGVFVENSCHVPLSITPLIGLLLVAYYLLYSLGLTFLACHCCTV